MTKRKIQSTNDLTIEDLRLGEEHLKELLSETKQVKENQGYHVSILLQIVEPEIDSYNLTMKYPPQIVTIGQAELSSFTYILLRENSKRYWIIKDCDKLKMSFADYVIQAKKRLEKNDIQVQGLRSTSH